MKRRKVLHAMEERVIEIPISEVENRKYLADCVVRYNRTTKAYYFVVVPTRLEGHSRMHFPEEVRSIVLEKLPGTGRFSSSRLKFFAKQMREQIQVPGIPCDMVESAKKLIVHRTGGDGGAVPRTVQ